MLIAIVDFEVAAQDRPAALSKLFDLATIVRAMPGCQRFHPFSGPQSRTHVAILHEWSDRESFAAYTASTAFGEIGKTLRPIMTAPPRSRRFDAELIEEVA